MGEEGEEEKRRRAEEEERRRGGATWLFGVVRFDAADVRRLLRHQDLHQLGQAVS